MGLDLMAAGRLGLEMGISATALVLLLPNNEALFSVAVATTAPPPADGWTGEFTSCLQNRVHVLFFKKRFSIYSTMVPLLYNST